MNGTRVNPSIQSLKVVKLSDSSSGQETIEVKLIEQSSSTVVKSVTSPVGTNKISLTYTPTNSGAHYITVKTNAKMSLSLQAQGGTLSRNAGLASTVISSTTKNVFAQLQYYYGANAAFLQLQDIDSGTNKGTDIAGATGSLAGYWAFNLTLTLIGNKVTFTVLESSRNINIQKSINRRIIFLI